MTNSEIDALESLTDALIDLDPVHESSCSQLAPPRNHGMYAQNCDCKGDQVITQAIRILTEVTRANREY